MGVLKLWVPKTDAASFSPHSRSLAAQAARSLACADAEATRIHGEAYDAGPEFYYCFRTLDSYDAFGENTTQMMDAESDFFRCLQTAVQPWRMTRSGECAHR